MTTPKCSTCKFHKDQLRVGWSRKYEENMKKIKKEKECSQKTKKQA